MNSLEDRPFARSFGTKLVEAGTELVCVTRWRDSFTGNPLLQAWHGGIVSGVMELTGLLAAQHARACSSCDLLSINVSYLKPTRGETELFSSAKVIRSGKQIMTIETQSWQGARDNVTACAMLTYAVRT